MMRENWRAWGFWRWWWHARVPSVVKIAALTAVAAVLLTGGYFASSHLTGASAASESNTFVLQTTVTRIVTLREHGKTVVKRIPVVIRRQVVHSKTSYMTIVDTHVVTTPGGVRYVTRKVLKYVPVVKKRVVKVNGKTRTLTETKIVPTIQTQTLTNVVTQQQTVTNQSTVVVKSTSTNVVTQPVTTVVTHTVTLPPDTVTETQTQTETETRTETVVQTITLPPDTITITVTTDSGGGGSGP